MPTWHCRLKDEWLDVREAQLICDSMSFIPERFHLRGKYTRERGSILLTNNVETEINVGEAKLSKTAEDMLASGYKLEELPEELQELSEPIHERTLQRFTNPRDFVRYSLWDKGCNDWIRRDDSQDFSRITIGDKTIDDLTRKLKKGNLKLAYKKADVNLLKEEGIRFAIPDLENPIAEWLVRIHVV